MNKFKRSFNLLLAVIWLVNGFFFKILDLVPRHQEIVGEILNVEAPYFLTFSIGLGETFIAFLILLNWRPKVLAWAQVILIMSMNSMEFIFIPEMLLFGEWNLLFAIILSLAILANQTIIPHSLASIKYHPFKMKALFRYCYIFTFSIPIKKAESFLHKGLKADSFNGEHAFYTIAIVDTKNLRPAFFPKFLGGSFVLIGHRIFVRLKAKTGKVYRGLQILKSETDSLRMKIIGNFFTHYNYEKSNIQFIRNLSSLEIINKDSGFKVKIDNSSKEPKLPKESPFISLKEAKKFAGPMPFTFSHLVGDNKLLTVEGKRQTWQVNPIAVQSLTMPDFALEHFPEAKLASAFKIENVDYNWQKGELIEF